MSTKQGDVGLLQDPVAQQLLQSTAPARFAYNWTDGTPRVEPIWFHWDGKQLVMASPITAPKARALKSGDKVAITIDTNEFPSKVTPEWVGILDFEQRFPSAIEKAVAGMQAS